MKDLLNKMKKLNENKNGKVVTFDFDNTIVKSFENKSDGLQVEYQFGGINPQIIARIKKFKKEGATVLVVTSRRVALEDPNTSVKSMLDRLGVTVDGIFYTNGDKKAQKLYELGSSLHYEDDPAELEAIEAFQQLHSDFHIKVVNGDSLLSDIEEVAKGIIITNDNKFIIVQRSDSYEWDAAGGHLMEGELPEFAFWREVNEEMQLKVTNLQFLDSVDTVWKKKNKLVHYYLSFVPYSSQELKGAIQLQWELADYFCGDIHEIELKMKSPDGSTQNLKNAINLMIQENHLLYESRDYQKTSQRLKDYPKDFEELTGQGRTGGSPYKNVKKPLGKSAPPGAPGGGWGPIGEEKDNKPLPKIKIRFLYDLDEKRKKKKKKKRKKKSRRTSKKGMGSWSTWPYGGSGGNSVDFGDGGGDGGGGE
jgi:8-oxo-dGTP pyrophosphatase MutT (NUDIX family)